MFNQTNLSIEDSLNFTHKFVVDNDFRALNVLEISKNFNAEHLNNVWLNLEDIVIDQALFTIKEDLSKIYHVHIFQQHSQLVLSCSYCSPTNNYCLHEVTALSFLLSKNNFSLFFDKQLRQQKLKKYAYRYGLENENNLDQYFNLSWDGYQIEAVLKNTHILPVNEEDILNLKSNILANNTPVLVNNQQNLGVVLKKHKYNKNLQIYFFESNLTKEGKVKNPIKALDAQDFLWKTNSNLEIKFFSAIDKFKDAVQQAPSEQQIAALKAVIKNPLQLNIYQHLAHISENCNANSLSLIDIKTLNKTIHLSVNKENNFYKIAAYLKHKNSESSLNNYDLKFDFFLVDGNEFYLIDQLSVLKLIKLLKNNGNILRIHESKFKIFKQLFLNEIENFISINYTYIKKATYQQLEVEAFYKETEKIIYLSDFGQHVMLIPVVRYHDAEIAIRSQRQIYGIDEKGKEFLVERDNNLESNFTALLIRQHPEFEEQLDNNLDHFYLHKKEFLNENWFLPVFEQWRMQNITILGFNELENNKVNSYKAKIDIKVLSGLNWFNVDINLKYGSRKASLKKIQKAVKNKSKYIELDDGTLGILPQEWLKKFALYFQTAEIYENDELIIPKTNFNSIETLFEKEQIDDAVKKEIAVYRKKVGHFNELNIVETPKLLKAKLRDYQKEGLNWLNFLDDFNFGGCLADDMGLGKTLQIIAFILHLKNKNGKQTHLLIVPTTLVFNWKLELEKFAPSLQYLNLQGTNRQKDSTNFENYDLIISTYHTLLSDINFLKKYTFNYIFLDESQWIKNPESLRYKSVKLLKSKNKIAITGTPVENSTFDIYSQFSIVCPGLLGSKQYFKDVYSIPIDRLKERKRAIELQEKIKPFLLRRTKEQVAKELPQKTELVLYCDMLPLQKKAYYDYEKEFRDFISANDNEVLKKSSMHVLKGLTKLRQICNSIQLIDKNILLKEESSAKIEVLIEQIESLIPRHKILVFSQFVSMLKLIEKELATRNIGYQILTGASKNRENIVNDFQENKNTKVFLISLKAGGVGLNLTAADYLFLVDPWWNPAVENQAIDRSHRIGQHKNITVTRLITPGTVEEKIAEMQTSKKDLANQLIITNNNFFKTLDKSTLLNLIK